MTTTDVGERPSSGRTVAVSTAAPAAGDQASATPALIQGAAKGVDNTGRLIQVASALMGAQDQQGQAIDKLYAMVGNGPRGRSLARRGV